ncbi:DNA cytosine methyltransferase [Chitinophaga agrisoli]|uniref:DNA cytosine methyltransferase n=1 Tax=Chitinophaga agrisoli TaxID=2607653 RepID=A0A5B2W0H9_9BACT|nr:DNA cytosine methyltransferase [Chitinophaga agrisoli]KAA2245513.1 DNA cytosine methyltransferase [Chitinophaga agrisoli]
MNSADIHNRLIISLYDFTGNWVKDYIDAGYPVMLWDKKIEGDILEGFSKLLSEIEDTGLKVHGVFAACPCTDFCASGARWWAAKDEPQTGYEPFESPTELSIFLVLIVLHFVDIVKPKFWVIENPKGRIEKLIPELIPYRRMGFNPCDFGDPYTKYTILWGEFNQHLSGQSALPLYGSLMHNIGPSAKRAEIRSTTPRGFARAFFEANS